MPLIRMDFAMMAEMKQEFQKGAEELDETINELNKIAELLEGGALIGEGGARFASALRGEFAGSVTRLRDKFEELARDIQAAVDAMQEADTDASEYYQ